MTISGGPASLVHHPFGRPMRRQQLPHQVLPKRYALPVFASDNLSSVAYATEEILLVLALAGTNYFGRSLWIAAIIMAGYAVIIISYRQTMFAYPNGGGAYIVTRDNLGEGPAQLAGAALLVDYILTVSVSIAAGVANLASGINQFFPDIPPFNSTALVISSLLMLGGMWYVNKMGVRESGRVFSVPTYFFLTSMFLMLGVGALKAATGHLGHVAEVQNVVQVNASMSLLLLLRAYASGNTAVTGVEAISNGITAFEEPKARNASTTMIVMGILVAVMFLGITKLALISGAQASESETVISQLGRTIFSPRSPLYISVIFGTAAILIMAANTSFQDFPRLAALHAGDGFLPRWMLDRDNRLVFGIGISVLSVGAGALLVALKASVTHLIPLYAIGVFLSITLSQAGMAIRWWRTSKLAPGERLPRYSPEGILVTTLERSDGWQWKFALSAFGAAMTAVITAVFAVSKFTEGAWVVLLLLPLLLSMFFRIHHHYRAVEHELTLSDNQAEHELLSSVPRLRLLVVNKLERHALRALRDMLGSSSPRVIREAIHVSVNDHETAELRRRWTALQLDERDIPLIVLPNDFGAEDIIGTIAGYVRGVLEADPNVEVELIIPEWATRRHAWNWFLSPFLHHLIGARLKLAFLQEGRVTITNYRHPVG